MNGYSQVTIKEEKPEHLDMWAFKDVVVGEVNKYTAALETKENVLLQKNQIFFRSKQSRKILRSWSRM